MWVRERLLQGEGEWEGVPRGDEERLEEVVVRNSEVDEGQGVLVPPPTPPSAAAPGAERGEGEEWGVGVGGEELVMEGEGDSVGV